MRKDSNHIPPPPKGSSLALGAQHTDLKTKPFNPG